jgi:hypothetical protein
MSTLKINNLQVGQSSTPTQNFTLYQPTVPDGTVRLGNGINGSVTDQLIVNSVGLGIGANTSNYLEVYKNGYSRFSVASSLYEGVVIGRRSANDPYATLTFNSGAATAQKIEGDGTVNTLNMYTNGTSRLSIDANGAIKTPYQPICQVTRNNGSETFAANTSYGLGSQFTINRGGFYNGGSIGGGGLVVHVPVDGLYRVTLNVYKQGGVSGRRLEVKSSSGGIICFTEITATGDGTYSSSGCINMTANQYIYLNAYLQAFQCYTAPMHTEVTIEYLG